MENLPPKILSRTRRLLLGLCSLFLAASAPVAAAALPAENVIFQAAPLLAALEENHFYQKYPRLMIAFSTAGGDLLTPGLGSWLAQNMVSQGAEDALRFIFPEPWVRIETQRLAAEYYAYTNFKSNSLDLALDLRPVKLRLTGGEGRLLLEQTLFAWPECTLDDGLLAAALLLQGRASELPRCKPPADLVPAYLEMLQFGMDAVSSGMPDRLRILPPRSAPPAGAYAFLRWALRISPLALLLFPLAAAALLGWSLRALLAWAGPPLYAGGLFAVLSTGLAVLLCVWLAPLPVAALPPSLVELYRFAGSLFLSVWREFLLAWTISGAALAATGMAFLITTSILDRRSKGA